MEIEGKTKVVKRIYDTDDIVRVVLDCFNKYYKTCADVAQSIAAYDAAGRLEERQTAYNIWQYVLDHCRYEEDGAFKQLVRSPARLMYDGVGDCKSMAIFCASCLTCLGVPCKFRFVSFTPNSEKASHVYVVTESGLNVDPVEAFQNGRAFNEVTPFTWHMDKVVDKGLAILSGLGATTAPFDIWTGDRAFYENTMAANYIYSEIDLALTDIRIDGDDVDALNRCTFWAVALTLYRQHSLDTDTLQRCGYVLQQMTNEGQFASADTSDEGRAKMLEALTSQAEQNLADGVEALSGEVVSAWDEQIMAKNFGANAAVRRAFDNEISGVGATLSVAEKNQILAQMKETGPYFFYYFLSDADVAKYRKKAPKIVAKRRIEQSVYENWVMSGGYLNVLDAKTIKNYIYSGVKEHYGMTPQVFLQKFCAGQLSDAEIKYVEQQNSKVTGVSGVHSNARIGFAISLIISIVTAVLGVVAAIINAVAKKLSNKAAKQAAQTTKEAEQIRQETENLLAQSGDGVMTADDLNALLDGGEISEGDGGTTASSNSKKIIPLVAAGAAAYFLFS